MKLRTHKQTNYPNTKDRAEVKAFPSTPPRPSGSAYNFHNFFSLQIVPPLPIVTCLLTPLITSIYRNHTIQRLIVSKGASSY